MGIRRITKKTIESLPIKQSLFTTQLLGDNINNTSEHFSRLSRQVYSFYSFVKPEETPDPVLLSTSPLASSVIDLDSDSISPNPFLDFFINQQYDNKDIKSWAMNYAGHQFSIFAGQLGDGRAITLFDTTNQAGERYEVQLKGAGRTPFSRFGDGYAVLRSSIREYLASEHLSALDIPTTRALALIGSSRDVYRDDDRDHPMERGALVIRLAPSWVRFGNFELFYSRNDMIKVRQLADFCIDHIYHLTNHQPYETTLDELKELNPSSSSSSTFVVNKYTQFFIEVAKKTAFMVAQWQSHGFNHGVMNTDNMSILGLTLDYGPYQFMDYYDPSNICNHSDDAGQYAFKRQPTVCIYNLFKLGVPLFELIGAAENVDSLIYATKEEEEEDDDVQELKNTTDDQTRKTYREIGKAYVTKLVSEEFTDWFMEDLGKIMRKKLGILRQDETVMHDVIIPLLDWATEYQVDYHRFLRSLSNYKITSEGEEKDNQQALYGSKEEEKESSSSSILDIITQDPAKLNDSKKALEPWLSMYRHCLLQESPMVQNNARKLRMDAVNPRFILRNWIAQDVIQTFQQSPDSEASKVLDACLYACTHPYEDHYNNELIERWCGPVPNWGQDLKCSCSS